jgi:hypothetical protein
MLSPQNRWIWARLHPFQTNRAQIGSCPFVRPETRHRALRRRRSRSRQTIHHISAGRFRFRCRCRFKSVQVPTREKKLRRYHGPCPWSCSCSAAPWRRGRPPFDSPRALRALRRLRANGWHVFSRIGPSRFRASGFGRRGSRIATFFSRVGSGPLSGRLRPPASSGSHGQRAFVLAPVKDRARCACPRRCGRCCRARGSALALPAQRFVEARCARIDSGVRP